VAQSPKKNISKTPLQMTNAEERPTAKPKLPKDQIFPPEHVILVFRLAKAHCESATCLSSKGLGEVKIMLACDSHCIKVHKDKLPRTSMPFR